MKSFFIIAMSVSVVLGCGNDTQQSAGNTNDSANHSSHDVGTTGSLSTIDTANMPSKTFMFMMQANMEQMKSLQPTGDADIDFASMMKTHHAGAVEMAQMEVVQGNNADLKQMAQKMINEQQKEIGELETYISNNKPGDKTGDFHNQIMKQMADMKMEMNHTGSTDQQFARIMIPHHAGAVEMSRIYLKFSKDKKLQAMANKMIVDQEREINDLKAWLAKNK